MPRQRRFGAFVATIVVTAVATLFAAVPAAAAPRGTASLAQAPTGTGSLAQAPAGPLAQAPEEACTTQEWRNPANFETCTNRLAEVGAQRARCVKAPTPSAPDSGMAGWFATKPGAYDKAGFKGQYTKYGYAGYDYTTYDLGCGSPLIHPDYKFENTIANGEFLIAASATGASNALRERAWNPQAMWAWANPLVKNATQAIYRKVFTVFGAVTLVVVGLYLLWRARQSDMSNAVTTAGWAIVVMVGVTAIASWPVWSANAADKTLITSLTVVHDAITPASQEVPAEECVFDAADCEDNREPALRASDTVVESMLYRNWLRGALGSADSETAKKYGPVLYDAKSFTWGEVQDIRRDPTQRQAIIDQKAKRWQRVAEQIKTEDPEAYEYLQGVRGMDRIGAGFIAILSAVFFALFDLTASLLVLLGFLIFRWAVIAAPILGTLGLLRPASTGLRRLANVVISAIFNIVIFGVGASVYLLAVDLIMSTASLPGWLQVMLVLLTGVVGWLLLRPYRRITQLGGRSAGESESWGRGLLRDLRAATVIKAAQPDVVVAGAGGPQRRAVDGRARPESRREDAPAPGAPVVAAAGPGTPSERTSGDGRPEDATTGGESTSRPEETTPAQTERPAAPAPARRAEPTWEYPDVPEEAPIYVIYRPDSDRSSAPTRTAQRPESASLPG